MMRHTFWDGCWNLTADWKLIRQSTTAHAKENWQRLENALVIMENWGACCSWKRTSYVLNLPLVQMPAYFGTRWSTSLSLSFNGRSLEQKCFFFFSQNPLIRNVTEFTYPEFLSLSLVLETVEIYRTEAKVSTR